MAFFGPIGVGWIVPIPVISSLYPWFVVKGYPAVASTTTKYCCAVPDNDRFRFFVSRAWFVCVVCAQIGTRWASCFVCVPTDFEPFLFRGLSCWLVGGLARRTGFLCGCVRRGATSVLALV